MSVCAGCNAPLQPPKQVYCSKRCERRARERKRYGTAAYNARIRRKAAKRRERDRAAGLCILCHSVPAIAGRRCESCRKDAAEAQRRWTHKDGRCRRCGADINGLLTLYGEQRRTCKKCAARRHSQRTAKRKRKEERRIQAGKCRTCGHENDRVGKLRCSACTRYQRIYSRRRSVPPELRTEEYLALKNASFDLTYKLRKEKNDENVD